MVTIDQQVAGNQNRRVANQNRMDTRDDVMDVRLDAAEELVGELCSEGKTVFYINKRKANGALMGTIKRFEYRLQAVQYLIRNDYV